ncbi:MAG TPA: hypothetical protein VN699_17970 [Pirellulales bacterium]|nr:hypothetical protein [Pirellulales bacterium]
MKQLLDGKFWPATVSYGFYLLPLDELVAAFEKWWTTFGWLGPPPGFSVDRFDADLAGALQRMDPVGFTSGPPQCYGRRQVLLLETKSRWSAIFVGEYSGPQSEIRHLARTIPCKAVHIVCVDDTYNAKRDIGEYGSVQFLLRGPARDESQDRTIAAVRDTSGWEFQNNGALLPFEHPDRYKARRVKDRLTQELLEEYCIAMGIRPFDEDFYGPRVALFYALNPIPPGYRPWTFDDIRREREKERQEVAKRMNDPLA